MFLLYGVHPRQTLSQLGGTVKRHINKAERIFQSTHLLIYKERYLWIYVLYNSGHSMREIAKLTGYSFQRISQIVMQFSKEGGEKSIKKTG